MNRFKPTSFSTSLPAVPAGGIKVFFYFYAFSLSAKFDPAKLYDGAQLKHV
jgi:hypothetical protein